ncbi:hypothetical protein ONZ45_g12167 [Pleurotus djamor]|nr:hypothetical protein ONZ45_g12167 [Pleurotus djamor]
MSEIPDPLTVVTALGDIISDDNPGEHDRETSGLLERPLPANYFNGLTPPVGTDYFRHQFFTIMNNQKIIYTEGSLRVIASTVTWHIDAYIYTVNAEPGSDFAARGGIVYVVLVSTGVADTGDAYLVESEHRFSTSVRSPPSGSAAVRHLPRTNSGVVNGNVTNYPVVYTQDMQMFKNSGNETTTFTARYEDSLDLLRQANFTGLVTGSAATRWTIMFDTWKARAQFPIVGLSVYRFSSMGLVTFGTSQHFP